MSITIAVDCDEILIETMHWVLEYANKLHGFDRKYDNIRHYMLNENETMKMERQWALDLFTAYYNNLSAKIAMPVRGAKEILQKRKHLWYKLVVVTARNKWDAQITKYQIDTHYKWIFDDIIYAEHYTNNHLPKSQLCKDIWASYLIEDNFDYALEVAEHNIQAFLIAKPRNARRHETHLNLHKVDSRADIDLSMK